MRERQRQREKERETESETGGQIETNLASSEFDELCEPRE